MKMVRKEWVAANRKFLCRCEIRLMAVLAEPPLACESQSRRGFDDARIGERDLMRGGVQDVGCDQMVGGSVEPVPCPALSRPRVSGADVLWPVVCDFVGTLAF